MNLLNSRRYQVLVDPENRYQIKEYANGMSRTLPISDINLSIRDTFARLLIQDFISTRIAVKGDSSYIYSSQGNHYSLRSYSEGPQRILELNIRTRRAEDYPIDIMTSQSV
jgi:hypothetical protein